MFIDLYPAHIVSDEKAMAENLAWFCDRWQEMAIGTVLLTDAGAYLRTPMGFRQITKPAPPGGLAGSPSEDGCTGKPADVPTPTDLGLPGSKIVD